MIQIGQHDWMTAKFSSKSKQKFRSDSLKFGHNELDTWPVERAINNYKRTWTRASKDKGSQVAMTEWVFWKRGFIFSGLIEKPNWLAFFRNHDKRKKRRKRKVYEWLTNDFWWDKAEAGEAEAQKTNYFSLSWCSNCLTPGWWYT